MDQKTQIQKKRERAAFMQKYKYEIGFLLHHGSIEQIEKFFNNVGREQLNIPKKENWFDLYMTIKREFNNLKF